MITRDGKIIRTSILKGDPGYYDEIMGGELEIKLDGVVQYGVITADVDDSLVYRYDVDDDGFIRFDGANAVTQVSHGVVEIKHREIPRGILGGRDPVHIIRRTVPRKR